MSTKLDLSPVISCYKAGNYDQAICSLRRMEKTLGLSALKETALIKLWLGKCYFHKKKTFTYRYNRPYQMVGKGYFSGLFLGPVEVCRVTENMLGKAFSFFEAALNYDATLPSAYYWKGKVLERQKKDMKAYECYIQAVKLSDRKRYFKCCSELFSKNEDFPFRETKSLCSLTLTTAIKATAHPNAYIRMEACYYLQTLISPRSETTSQIEKALAPLAGSSIYGHFIPFTGDEDGRVRELARAILKSL